MSQFKDKALRDWDLTLTVTHLKRVRTQTSVDLLAILDDSGALLGKLYDDPVTAVEVLYAICEPQAQQRNLSAEDFGGLFANTVLRAATDALVEAVADFFPNQDAGRAVRQMAAKVRASVDLMLGTLNAALDKVDVEAELQSQLSASATDSPESSELTPEASVSAN